MIRVVVCGVYFGLAGWLAQLVRSFVRVPWEMMSISVVCVAPQPSRDRILHKTNVSCLYGAGRVAVWCFFARTVALG